jgi:hypothetical protein
MTSPTISYFEEKYFITDISPDGKTLKVMRSDDLTEFKIVSEVEIPRIPEGAITVSRHWREYHQEDWFGIFLMCVVAIVLLYAMLGKESDEK